MVTRGRAAAPKKRKTSAPREANPIDVVEAAYDLDATDTQWLEKLATAVRPLIDDGHGAFAYYFDVRVPIEVSHAAALLFDMERSLLAHGIEMTLALPDVAHYVHFHNEGLDGLIAVGRRAGLGDLRERSAVSRYFEIAGIADFAALQTIEPSGRGVVVAAGQSRERTFDARTRRLWARVNAHIAAGRRLRESIAGIAGTEGADAVLTPSGKLAHAEGEATAKSARESLRDAVLRTEKSRGRMRRTDPEGATEAWTALVSGRWSLVDRFESDGRRYIVARRNEHVLPDPRALTPRERAIAHLAALGKSNKLIGYELGIAESTVGSHLSLAMRKLGAKSRGDLIRLLAALGG